jgi:hypothetical protein
MSVVSTNRKSKIENRKLGAFSVEWDPSLVEEAVLLAAEARRTPGFRGRRNRLYEIHDPEQRDVAFREFHADWFERLELGKGIWQALQEQPLIPTSTRACVVVHSRGHRDEGADLFVSPAGEGTGETEGRSVVISLEPRRLLDEEGVLAFFRHELFHIADMLDPAFAYEPRLPRGDLGPAHERLLQDRYRVLWDIYIDGRLVHKNWAPSSVRDRRLEEFIRTFPMLADRTGEAFSHFFNSTSLTHPDLVSFVINPTSSISNFQFPISNLDDDAGHRFTLGERCPLCGFPTYAFEPNPDQLPPDVIERIRGDFQAWDCARGLCQQCADLYRTRSGAFAGAPMTR